MQFSYNISMNILKIGFQKNTEEEQENSCYIYKHRHNENKTVTKHFRNRINYTLYHENTVD